MSALIMCTDITHFLPLSILTKLAEKRELPFTEWDTLR